MRSIWKGAVSFGLISIAVKAYAATETKNIRFHQVHRPDMGRIRYRKFCEAENTEVDTSDIVRAVELPDRDLIVLEDSDFDQLPLATKNVIDVIEFVPAEDIDPLMYAKSYYLEPDGPASKPYALLRKTLGTTDKVAVAKVALRQKEQLATLRDHDGVLVLQTMLWPDEVRDADLSIPDDKGVRDQELTMATTLVDSMSSDHFDADKYHDEYRAALEKIIDAKISGDEVEERSTPASNGGGKVIDLMDALQRSVDKAKKDQGSSTKKTAKKTAKKSTKRKKAA